MAICRKHASIFTRAISFAVKKEGLSCLRTLPSPIRFRSLVSDFKKMRPALVFDLIINLRKLGEKSCPVRLPNHLEMTLFF